MTMQGFGAPSTRPEEDTCVIPFSYDINRDMREWETTAAIAWSFNAPRKLDALDVDRAIRVEFHISHADIVVPPHHPEQFLVKFANKAQCDEVLKKGRTTARGLAMRIRPYRPLEHAFAASMAFRVHLCLEKVPAFPWMPRIVERIIGWHCSFDRLDRKSAFMEKTDTLDLWAWTTNPNLIPKVMWVTFMGRSLNERTDEILVTDYRPSGIKRGSSYRVIIP